MDLKEQFLCSALDRFKEMITNGDCSKADIAYFSNLSKYELDRRGATVDKIMDGLTESQKSYLNQNQDFVESYQDVANILQREELRIIRPLVEQTKDGKEALDKHLALIKKLKKNALQEEDKNMALWKDYITNHSDKTWQEYLELVKKGGSK